MFSRFSICVETMAESPNAVSSIHGLLKSTVNSDMSNVILEILNKIFSFFHDELVNQVIP